MEARLDLKVRGRRGPQARDDKGDQDIKQGGDVGHKRDMV